MIRTFTSRRPRPRSAVVAAAAVAVFGWSGGPSSSPSSTAAASAVAVPSTAPIGLTALAGLDASDLPEGCVEPNRHLTLYAVELARVDGEVRLGYGVTPDSASYPGPTIEMVEGECLAITLINDVPAATLAELRDHPRLGLLEPDPDFPLGVSLHVHGVKYTTASDGTMHTGSWVPPGGARTYVWYAEPPGRGSGSQLPSHGTAGYWWYHDHVAGTDHGTGGVGSGLFGALVVRRPGDPLPDFTYVVAMGDDARTNLRSYPDVDTCDPEEPRPSPTCFVARVGDRVEFVVFGTGNDFHTFHLHGHTWVDNRHGTLTPTDSAERIVDVIPLGPSASFGFQVVAGSSVGHGDWMIHCHVQRHSDLGMFTFLHVLPAGATLTPPGSVETLDRMGVTGTDDLAAGARFRGASSLPPERPAQGSLGYYCSLPLSRWAAADRTT